MARSALLIRVQLWVDRLESCQLVRVAEIVPFINLAFLLLKILNMACGVTVCLARYGSWNQNRCANLPAHDNPRHRWPQNQQTLLSMPNLVEEHSC